MGPYVAVEVAPARAEEGALRAMLDACSAALPRGSCVTQWELPSSEPAAASASVSFADELHAHLEVRIEASRASTLVRDLTFSERNPRFERFRSVGLAIATMVDELNVTAETDEAPKPPPSADTTAAKPPAPAAPLAPARPPPAGVTPPSATESTPPAPNPPPRTARRSAFEAGALVASGAAGAPRLGPFARVEYDVEPSFYVNAGFASSFRTASSAPSMLWNELEFGGGARVSGAVRAELGAEMTLVSVTASATSPFTRASDRQSVWIPAVALESRLSWPTRSALSATLGARATWLAKAVTVTNAGEAIAHVPAYNVGATLGARFAF